MSGITQTASTQITGINLVGTFDAAKLPQGVTTQNHYNYVQTGNELVGTIVA